MHPLQIPKIVGVELLRGHLLPSCCRGYHTIPWGSKLTTINLLRYHVHTIRSSKFWDTLGNINAFSASTKASMAWIPEGASVVCQFDKVLGIDTILSFIAKSQEKVHIRQFPILNSLGGTQRALPPRPPNILRGAALRPRTYPIVRLVVAALLVAVTAVAMVAAAGGPHRHHRHGRHHCHHHRDHHRGHHNPHDGICGVWRATLPGDARGPRAPLPV